MATAREIIIPVGDSDLGVAVSLEALPEDESDILQILQAEQAPLRLWLDFAKAYLQQGREDQARRVLEDGCSDEIEQYYGDSKFERVSLLCASASFYTRKGRLEKDKKRRDECFERANRYVWQANQVDGTEQLPWLARGHLALARNNLEEASKSFQSAAELRDNGAVSVAPVLGAGCCAFSRGAYQEALRLFGRALRLHPNGPPAARLGLGATLLRLGQADRAQAAFQRVVELDANCAEGHLGLALCAAARDPGNLPEALAALRTAYQAAPQLSPVLLLLSEHATLCSQSIVGEAFARAGAEAADGQQLRGAAALQLGRLAHAAGRASDAVKQYNVASAYAPSDLTPHFGLGQVALARDELQSATAHLERIAATPAGAACSRRALGHIFASSSDPDRRQRAKELLRAAAETDPADAGICVELAELLRDTSMSEALAEYGKAITARRAAGQPMSPVLLNNAGVLAAAFCEAEDGPRRARDHYAAALQACGAGWISELGRTLEGPDASNLVPAGHAAVVTFNLACLEDDAGNTKAAAALFAQLRRDCPAEVDVLLRHALSEMSRGALESAEELASEAHTAAPRNPDAVALLGALATARRDFKTAQVLLDSFRKGLTGVGGAHAFGYDEYIMVCAANALLADSYRDIGARIIRADGPSEAEAAARRDNRLERALALYSKALARAPGNAYAANGIGNVLAERGRLDEADAVFSSVAEAAGGLKQLSGLAHASLINSAHCQLGLGVPGRAVRLYEQAIRKSTHGATDAGVLLCNARALHDWKGDGESRLRHARASLLRALHLAPGDHRARFDVAFVSQEQAVRLLARFREQPAGSDGRLALADAAADELSLALRLFRQLLALGEVHAHGFDGRRTSVHAAFCADALGKASAFRAQARREQEASHARRAAQELARAAAEEHLRQVEEARATADATSRDRLEEQARLVKERLDQAKQRWEKDKESDEAAGNQRSVAKVKDSRLVKDAGVDDTAPEYGGGAAAQEPPEAETSDAVDARQSLPGPWHAAPVGEVERAHKEKRRLRHARGAWDDAGAGAKRAHGDLEEGDATLEDEDAEVGAAPRQKRRVNALSDED